MGSRAVSFASTLLFIAAIGAALYTGLSLRTVQVYSCTYSYETTGVLDYADKRYYTRGIECINRSQASSCDYGTNPVAQYQGSKIATEGDIERYERSADGNFYDGFEFRNVSFSSAE